MRRTIGLVGMLVFVGACGPSQIGLPVVGKLSNGQTAQGNVVIDLVTMEGAFDITTLSGFRCDGTYDADLRLNTISIPITCNNGQKGTVIATRDASGMAGTASAQLQNGMSGKFLFGNVSAQMQADFLN